MHQGTAHFGGIDSLVNTAALAITALVITALVKKVTNMEKIGTKTAHGSIEIDKMLGNICTLTFTHGDRNFSPLHTAHWVENSDDQMLPEGLAPVERRLAGDFFCAPLLFPI